MILRREEKLTTSVIGNKRASEKIQRMEAAFRSHLPGTESPNLTAQCFLELLPSQNLLCTQFVFSRGKPAKNLYSCCELFYTLIPTFSRPDSKCHVTLNGQDVYIQTWTLTQGGVTRVGSAYPDWSLQMSSSMKLYTKEIYLK